MGPSPTLLPSTFWRCHGQPRTSCCAPTSPRVVSNEDVVSWSRQRWLYPWALQGHPAAGTLLWFLSELLSFSPGIEYNLVRLPMACSDFSTRPYSYDDVPNDYELKHFRLAEEDVTMKVGG